MILRVFVYSELLPTNFRNTCFFGAEATVYLFKYIYYPSYQVLLFHKKQASKDGILKKKSMG